MNTKYEEKHNKNKERSRSRNGNEEIKIKEKPCFIPSGILYKINNANSNNNSENKKIQYKFSEPIDSSLPSKLKNYYILIFDKEIFIKKIKLKNKSFFLFGKEETISDIVINDKTCSRQHSLIQFRNTTRNSESKILPYLIDLNSQNGTYLNRNKIESDKYYQLLNDDILNFGRLGMDFIFKEVDAID